MDEFDQAIDTAGSASAPPGGSRSDSAPSSAPDEMVFEMGAETQLASSCESGAPGDPSLSPFPWDTGPFAPSKAWQAPSPSRLRWTRPEIPAHKMSTRRTGVAFLSLILTTNSIPWMQLTQSVDASGPRLSGYALLVVATCLVAAILVILAWFLGRRLPEGWGPRIERPRDSGLMLAILAAGLNLALAVIIRWSGADDSRSVVIFGALWFLLAVPTQIGAAFCKGRASIPFALPKPPATQKAITHVSSSTGSTGERVASSRK